MNIHPILVHFPIALLTVYVVLECLRFKKLVRRDEWFYVKTAFLLLGGLGALAADFTGDFGKSLYPAARAIVRVHESFAKGTIAVFGILALIYLVMLIEKLWGERIRSSASASSWNGIMRIEEKLFNGYVLVLMALAGMVLLFITGTLGGSIVYGLASDPFTQFINKIFVK